MSVLSNIAAAAMGTLDRVAGTCLARVHGPEVQQRQVRRLRNLLAGAAPAAIAVPAALSFVADPATAMPLGFGVVAAGALLAAGVSLAPERGAGEPASVEGPADERLFAARFCPGLMVLLDAQGQVVATDGRDREAYLAHLRDPLGRAFAEQVHVSDRIAFLQALDGLRQGADAAVAEVRLERLALGREAGQFMSVRVDLTADRDQDGELLAMVAQLTDIGAEVSARAEARRLAGEIEQANDTKSRFLAAVSHELRTPLNAILGFSDILSGEYFGRLENDRQREYVHLIHQSGAHLLSVVNAMLDMSKIEAGRYELVREPFEIAQTVRECESMLGLQAREKGVALTSRLGRELAEVVADQRAVRQMLINLIGNAIKFTEPGGAVIVDATVADNRLTLTVGDTGIGIAPEKLALIGQPFTQIHDDYARRYDGSGLGLALVKGLTALHGGRFELTSRPGEGTVVTITLPADGCGDLGLGDADDGVDAAVEFPPRLRLDDRQALDQAAATWDKVRAMTTTEYTSKVRDDGAKAKIA